MNTMKIITTVWICTMMLIILWSCKGLTWKKDKSSIIGFSFMEIVYIFSLICMWNQTISECNSVGRRHVLYTGCRRFESCHSDSGFIFLTLDEPSFKYLLAKCAVKECQKLRQVLQSLHDGLLCVDGRLIIFQCKLSIGLHLLFAARIFC